MNDRDRLVEIKDFLRHKSILCIEADAEICICGLLVAKSKTIDNFNQELNYWKSAYRNALADGQDKDAHMAEMERAFDATAAS